MNFAKPSRRWQPAVMALVAAASALLPFAGSGQTVAGPEVQVGGAVIPRAQAYAACATCANCHDKIYAQHVESMHVRSFSNPVFQAEYSQDLLPRAGLSRQDFHEARSCTACHAPVAHRLYGPRLVPAENAQADNTSVTCDFCHTITGFSGEQPGNANYRCEPGDTKYGPFRTRSDWHHHYSALQTRSEFCAICHSVRNRFNLEIKSTYAEWKESPQAREGIECQDCHMSVNGFLSNGRPIHDSGQAASMTLGSSPARVELFTHRFVGARSHSQIEGAIQLAFKTPQTTPAPGATVDFVLNVDNSRTGHKLPSGSIELRYLWLDVWAQVGDSRFQLFPVSRPGSDGYDITGERAQLDLSILAGAVPPGRRIYRAILADEAGHPTLAFYQAKTIVFDNRLNASEVREEPFQFSIPDTSADRVVLTAAMYYVAYPDSFAERLGLSNAEPIRIAAAKAEFPLKPR